MSIKIGAKAFVMPDFDRASRIIFYLVGRMASNTLDSGSKPGMTGIQCGVGSPYPTVSSGQVRRPDRTRIVLPMSIKIGGRDNA